MTEDQGQPAIDTTAIDPNEFAQGVGAQTDEQLRAVMDGEMREFVLDEIFKRMGEHFDAEKGKTVTAVVHWKITGHPSKDHDHYELAISEGICEVTKDGSKDPRLTMTVDSVDFLKLVTNNVQGPELFMGGKLQIEGDVMFAATLTPLFKIPGQDDAATSGGDSPAAA
jgi:putative sterol carrier protein